MLFNQYKNTYSMLQVFLLICCCYIRFTASIDTIRVNQPLRDPANLVSSGEKFKLGFFSPENSSYRYVGIMYNLPVMTVIWVANRDNPLNDSTGVLEVSGDGNLVILDGQKMIVWSSNLPTPAANSNSSALLLDTGNLVLINSSNIYAWESFRHASDSFVANLAISTDSNTNEKNMLTSWRSPSDPGPGTFTCTVDPVGIPECFIWKDGDPYWRSGPWNGQTFIGVPNMNSNHKHGLDIVTTHSGSAYLSFTLLNSSELVYYMLNSSGAFQEKEWSDDKGEWVINWSSVDNECDFYGKCGAFGSCNNQGRPRCTCFPGFEPKINEEWRAGNWSNGCIRKKPLQCGNNSSVVEVGKRDRFLKMSGVKLPDHDIWFPIPEAECRSQCLNNCSCIAYAYGSGTGCMIWEQDLIDLQKYSNGVADLYIRLASSGSGNASSFKNSVVI